jgi:hypothetical protein
MRFQTVAAAFLAVGPAFAAPSPAPAPSGLLGNVTYASEAEFWATVNSPAKRDGELQARGPSVYVCGGVYVFFYALIHSYFWTCTADRNLFRNWSGPCTTIYMNDGDSTGVPYDTVGSVDAHGKLLSALQPSFLYEDVCNYSLFTQAGHAIAGMEAALTPTPGPGSGMC